MAVAAQHKRRYIFHFTDIRNLDSIIKHGLLCPNLKKERGIKHKNIANMAIQERRAKMDVTVGPKGKVHDYVPFYFSSMNPMLLTLLNQKNVDQNLLIYFCLKIDKLESENVVFTDASANRLESPNFYNNVAMLDQLDWELIDSRKWSVETDEAKHNKMAEVLIYQKVDIAQIDGIVVYNREIKNIVEQIFKENKITPPPIMLVWDDRVKNYSFYYTKFYVKGQENETLVTGPLVLAQEYFQVVKDIVTERVGLVDFPYQTIEELVHAIDKNFCIIPELEAVENLRQDYYPHNDTVDVHTLRVVEEMKGQEYYQRASHDIKNLLLLVAYLHDIGKGPKDKWEDKKMVRAYPDHPADAIPMLKRILIHEVANMSEEDIRKICMSVIYHDIVGECMNKGRDIEQIANVITNKDDLELLFAMSIADTKAINPHWADCIIDRKQKFCEKVLALKSKQ